MYSLTEYVISNIAKTNLYKDQVDNQNINVLTGEEFDNVTNTYENNRKLLGITSLINKFSILLVLNITSSNQILIVNT